MKTVVAVAVGALSLSFVASAAAQPRDYRHGYYDCLAGRYDEDRDNHAYREGCRAARREREDEGEGMYGAPRYAPPPQGGFGAPPPYRAPYEPRYRPPAAPPNVRGMETAQALSVLAANGYQQVGARGFGAAVVAFLF